MPEPLRRRVRVRALRALAWATATPADPLVRGALAAAARLARWTPFERVTLSNLERVGAWPAAERERLAAAVRSHAARQLHEWLVLSRAARGPAARARVERWLAEKVELDPSVQSLREERSRGRPLLIATAHLGNWELLAARLRMEGIPGAVVGFRKARDPSADWLVRTRAALGVETLPQDAPPRRVLEVLRSGLSLGLLCDLDARRVDHVELPFLGHPALTMTAPAALARATRLPLWPVRCVARGERYLLQVEEPLELNAVLPRREASMELLARLNEVFGRWILEDPGQWAWHQRRWPEP